MGINYDSLAANIVQLVGGEQNIRGLTHCMSRLRFELVDYGKAKTDEISNLTGVLKVINSGGQYQIVIGTKVDAVYQAIISKTAVNAGSEVNEEILDTDKAGKAKKSGLINRLMDTVSGVLAPTLHILAAAGIIKGLIALALTLGWVSETSGLYMLLYSIGDGFYYFLPIILGFTAARKFKMNEIIGATIGAALVYPGMVNISSTMEVAGTVFAGTSFAMNYYNTFLGIPVIMPGTGYTSSIIPIIIAVYLASKLEKALRKRLPEVVKGILTPVIVLLVTVVSTYLIIGPLSMGICGLIALLVTFLYNIPIAGGIIAGALIGGGFGILVMFGLHWVVISLGLSTIAVQGFDYMLACGSIGPMIGMAQGIAICVAAARNKNQQVLDLALPGTLSQICGVGEPLMYSVLIPLKKELYLNILAGCVGGAVLGLLGTKIYVFGGSGLFSFPNFVSITSGTTDLVKYCIGVAVGCIFAFVAQLMIYKDDRMRKILATNTK